MKLTNRLTELIIKQAKTKEKQYKLTDGEGMFLRVYPNGSKYWQLQYRFNDKWKILSLGVWPDVKLTDAREKRFEARKKIKEGTDPIEEKLKIKILAQAHENEKEEMRKGSIKFQKIAQEWHLRQSAQWSEKHTKDVINSLKYHVFPELGEKPISEITKQDLIHLLRKLEADGMHETCYRVRQRLEAIFDYAKIAEYCVDNHASRLQKIFTKPQPKSQNSIPVTELPEFLHKIEGGNVTSRSTVLAMKFMILTFVRSSELRLAVWDEIDIDSDKPIWVIPSERMKMRKIHHIPLSPQAVNILREMKNYSGPEGYVFPQVRNPQKAMSENTLLYFSNRLGYAGRNTIHGFRTLASTVLNESQMWHPDAIELQLAHQPSNKVRRTYNRAEHMEERRRMMEWWSDYVDLKTATTDVIELEKRRKNTLTDAFDFKGKQIRTI